MYYAFGYDEGIPVNPQGDLSGTPSDITLALIYETSEERNYDVMGNPYHNREILYKVGENQGRKIIMRHLNALRSEGLDIGNCLYLNLCQLITKWVRIRKENHMTTIRVEKRNLKKDGIRFPNWWKQPTDTLPGQYATFTLNNYPPTHTGQIKADGTINGYQIFNMKHKQACISNRNIQVKLEYNQNIKQAKPKPKP